MKLKAIEKQLIGSSGADEDEDPTKHHRADVLVTPEALREFHFDMQLQDKDHDGVEDKPEQTLAAIYTVMVGAVGAAFKTERAKHLISQECLGNLELSLQVSHDFLVKGLKESDHPLVEFWHDVKKWLEEGPAVVGLDEIAPSIA